MTTAHKQYVFKCIKCDSVCEFFHLSTGCRPMLRALTGYPVNVKDRALQPAPRWRRHTLAGCSPTDHGLLVWRIEPSTISNLSVCRQIPVETPPSTCAMASDRIVRWRLSAHLLAHATHSPCFFRVISADSLIALAARTADHRRMCCAGCCSVCMQPL